MPRPPGRRRAETTAPDPPRPGRKPRRTPLHEALGAGSGRRHRRPVKPLVSRVVRRHEVKLGADDRARPQAPERPGEVLLVTDHRAAGEGEGPDAVPGGVRAQRRHVEDVIGREGSSRRRPDSSAALYHRGDRAGLHGLSATGWPAIVAALDDPVHLVAAAVPTRVCLGARSVIRLIELSGPVPGQPLRVAVPEAPDLPATPGLPD